jgi:hypothetical protein
MTQKNKNPEQNESRFGIQVKQNLLISSSKRNAGVVLVPVAEMARLRA